MNVYTSTSKNSCRIPFTYSDRRQAGKCWQVRASGSIGDGDTVGAKKTFSGAPPSTVVGEAYLYSKWILLRLLETIGILRLVLILWVA